MKPPEDPSREQTYPEPRVIAYSGCCYAQEPREFYLGERRHMVKRVIDTRLEETLGLEGMTRQVWRVEDHEGTLYLLTYYWNSDFWEVERI